MQEIAEKLDRLALVVERRSRRGFAGCRLSRSSSLAEGCGQPSRERLVVCALVLGRPAAPPREYIGRAAWMNKREGLDSKKDQ